MIKFLHLYVFLFLLFLANLIFAQQNKIIKDIYEKDNQNQIEILRTTFGKNKVIPKKYELQCLIALSYYPELLNTHIKFKQKHIQTTMASRPAFSVIFKQKKNIFYNICINDSKNLTGALITDISFNEQIGVFGHELGHILDYTKKNKWQLLTTAFRYIFVPVYKKDLEAKVDITTINHGLGWQLFDFVDFLLNKSLVNPQYKKHKIKFYLSDKEILKFILKNPIYSDSLK